MKGRIFLLAFFTVVASSPNLSTFISRAKLHVFSSQRSICHNVSWRKVFRQESPQSSTTNARMLDSLFKWHCSCFHPTMIRLSRTGVGAQGHTPFTVANRPNSKWLELCRAGRSRFGLFTDEKHPGGGPPIVLSRKKLLHRSAARGSALRKTSRQRSAHAVETFLNIRRDIHLLKFMKQNRAGDPRLLKFMKQRRARDPGERFA